MLLSRFDFSLNDLTGHLASDFSGVMASHSVTNDVEPEFRVRDEVIFIVFSNSADVCSGGYCWVHAAVVSYDSVDRLLGTLMKFIT